MSSHLPFDITINGVQIETRIRSTPGQFAVDRLILDCAGSYLIPYIQSADEMTIGLVGYTEPTVFTLHSPDGSAVTAAGKLNTDGQYACFSHLAAGEYRLTLVIRPASDPDGFTVELGPLGVGWVIAALGDSLTEGFFGHGFWRNCLDRLDAQSFPSAAVSKDGRNFPQHSPSSYRDCPEVNTMQSWMTRLNNRLTASLSAPVFIANEGWGGVSSAEYLVKIQNDSNWQARMRDLSPNLWLIHLGVNDGRANCSSSQVIHHLGQIIDLLIDVYRAEAWRIVIARPSYDYAEGKAVLMKQYGDAITQFTERRGIGLGPDFYTVYEGRQAELYGNDVVHPNPAGLEVMADQWHDAIVCTVLQD